MGNGNGFAINFPQICSLTGITDSTPINRVDYAKTGADDQVPALVDSDISTQAFRKIWARLIQKIYPVK